VKHFQNKWFAHFPWLEFVESAKGNTHHVSCAIYLKVKNSDKLLVPKINNLLKHASCYIHFNLVYHLLFRDGRWWISQAWRTFSLCFRSSTFLKNIGSWNTTKSLNEMLLLQYIYIYINENRVIARDNTSKISIHLNIVMVGNGSQFSFMCVWDN
jgi:hypothetical protein